MQSDNPDIYIERVQHETATAAMLTVRGRNAADSEGAAFSLVVGDGILNGFRPLVVGEITVDASASVFDEPFEVVILKMQESREFPVHQKVIIR